MMNDFKEPLIFPNVLPLHKQLRLKRLYDHFSQPELAAIIGCCSTTVSEIEAGKRRIPRKYMDKVRDYVFHEQYEEKKLVEYVD